MDIHLPVWLWIVWKWAGLPLAILTFVGFLYTLISRFERLRWFWIPFTAFLFWLTTFIVIGLCH